MSGNVIIPRHYLSKLELLETEVAIKAAKDTFEAQLSAALGLTRVSAPLFVRPESGLNDDLNGVERPVQFDILDVDGAQVQIVQSLAKWKRMALAAYGFGPGTGLYTDMNAIRRDELLDNLHSVYVDQWDWELVITPQQRNRDFLREKVTRLWQVFTKSQQLLCRQFPQLSRYFPESITFVSTQELEERWPEKTPREREDAIAKEHGAVFLMGIGGTLSSGAVHDGRAPDYDDWSLNGDILIWYPVLERAVELSSMGIRVDAAALERQLAGMLRMVRRQEEGLRGSGFSEPFYLYGGTALAALLWSFMAREPAEKALARAVRSLKGSGDWDYLTAQARLADRAELRRYVDDRTPFFMRSGVYSQLATGCSSVERLVIMREQMERLRKSHLNDRNRR